MTRRLYGSLLGMVFVVNFGRVAFAPLVEPLQAAFDVGPAAVGAETLPGFKERAEFVRVSSAGQTEGHPHDVMITDEAPNYSPNRD